MIDVTPFIRPRSIAIVGASDQEGSFGWRLLDAISSWRYDGASHLLIPRRTEVLGRPCYPSLAHLPEAVDLVTFAVGDDRIESALTAAGAAGAKAAVIFGRAWEADVPGQANKAERLGRIAAEAGIGRPVTHNARVGTYRTMLPSCRTASAD